LADKSITICSDNFSDDTSFINFGILRFLAEKNNSRVKSYPWDTSSPMCITDELVSDVISDIDIELEKLPSSSTFRRDQDAHCMVAISELLRLFIALKENEIHEYLVDGVSNLNGTTSWKFVSAEAVPHCSNSTVQRCCLLHDRNCSVSSITPFVIRKVQGSRRPADRDSLFGVLSNRS
jgi:hypothetical protein